MNPRFYVTHMDTNGERHQIGDAFEAKTPEDALYTILEMSSAEDDGNYEVFADAGEDRIVRSRRHPRPFNAETIDDLERIQRQIDQAELDLANQHRG